MLEKIISFEALPSTNQYLKENYSNLEHFTIITCENQTHGRGRLGRSWFSSKDSGVFSILLFPQYLNNINITFIPLVCAYATLKVLSKYVDSLQVKWPNDIVLSSKKLAGILVEAVTTTKIEAIIVGIGININNSSFNEEISSIATSLYLNNNSILDKKTIIADIANELKNSLILDPSEIISYLNDNLYIKGKEVSFSYNNEIVSGVVCKINQDGSLKVSTNKGIINVSSGEVTLTNLYK